MHTELKDRVECWFRLLRLAHKSVDPTIQSNLKKNTVYSAWGDYRNTSFSSWWKEHKIQFQNVSKIRRLCSTDAIESDHFVISIPLIHTPTSVAKIVKEMYDREFSKMNEGGRKQKRIFNGQFELSGEIRLTRMHYYLFFIEKIYLPQVEKDSSLKTYAISKRTHDCFAKFETKLKRTKTPKPTKIPFTSGDYTSQSSLKSIRNYISVSKKLLLNVSLGIFPGDLR